MEKNQNASTEQNTSYLQQIAHKYLPYWPLFLILLALSYGGLFYFLKTTSPEYETVASLLIKDQTKGQRDSQLEEDLNQLSTNKTVENETQILASNDLVREVVLKLNLYSPIRQDIGWGGLRTQSAYYTSPVLVEAKDPLGLRDSEKIYFKFSPKDSSVTIGNSKHRMQEWLNTSSGEIRFVANPNFRKQTGTSKDQGGEYFFNLVELNKAVKYYVKKLVVSPVSRQSSVINMKLQDEIPERAELFLVTLVDIYNANSLQRKNQIALKTLEFINNRLRDMSAELNAVESNIQKFRDRSNIVDISEQSRLYLQSVEANDRQINNLDIQLSALEETEKYVDQKGTAGSIAPSTSNITDPGLTDLLQKLYTAESQYETLKKTTAENNPLIVSINDDIASLKPKIIENIRNQRRTLMAGRSSLDRTNSRYNSLLNTIPQKERELVEVSRQQSIKNDIYKFLLEKKEETEYSMNSAMPDCFLVEKPTSTVFPVNPKKPLLALLATIMPLILGISMTGIKDALSSKIMYRSEIEKMTKFPVIGEIHFEKNLEEIVFASKERTFVQEQFRQIRTALKHRNKDKKPFKRILVTSSIKGEGKSFVSANLAVSLVKSGKKVALLEMDLHQPKINEMLQVEKVPGIAEYLELGVNESELFRYSSIDPNLVIIPSGEPSEDPSELLVNGKLEILLDSLDKQFDILIIDSAPVMPLSDAIVIAPTCDLVLYVVRHNHTPKANIQMLDEHMSSHNIDNIAIIFNGVKNRGFGQAKYGYGYGYGSKYYYNDYRKKGQTVSVKKSPGIPEKKAVKPS
jgi:tyrosine-protein kinase Etk/Wzc